MGASQWSLNTPMTWLGALAGLVSGPSRLNMVRAPISRRGPMACFMAPWCAGANMNPTPTSRMQRATCSGVQVQAHPQGLQYVGAAAAPGRRAVAVLGDAGPCRRRHEGAGGGDVECTHGVAAGAAGVHEVICVHLDPRSQLAHHPCRGGKFVDGLALHAQTDKKPAGLGLGGLAAHDEVHHGGHVLHGQIAVLGDSADGLLHVHDMRLRSRHGSASFTPADLRESFSAVHGRIG